MLLLETNKQVSNTVYNCNCVVNKDVYFEVRESFLGHALWFWQNSRSFSYLILRGLAKESTQLCSIYDMHTEVLQICTLI